MYWTYCKQYALFCIQFAQYCLMYAAYGMQLYDFKFYTTLYGTIFVRYIQTHCTDFHPTWHHIWAPRTLLRPCWLYRSRERSTPRWRRRLLRLKEMHDYRRRGSHAWVGRERGSGKFSCVVYFSFLTFVFRDEASASLLEVVDNYIHVPATMSLVIFCLLRSYF